MVIVDYPFPVLAAPGELAPEAVEDEVFFRRQGRREDVQGGHDLPLMKRWCWGGRPSLGNLSRGFSLNYGSNPAAPASAVP